MMSIALRSFIVAIASLCCLRQCLAFESYAAKMPNGNNVPGDPAIGHPDAAGVQGQNEFGNDFKVGAYKWASVCTLDSDKDGFTNGQELGDPCCTWKDSSGDAKIIKDGLGHPGKEGVVPTNPELTKPCAAAPPAGQTPGGGGVILDDDEDDSSELKALSGSSVRYSINFLVSLVSITVLAAIANIV